MILRATFIACIALSTLAPVVIADPQYHWSSRFFSARLRVDAVAMDPGGNSVIVGYADTYTNFGNGPVGGSGPDVFAAKFDPFGVLLWARNFPGSVSTQEARAVAIDAQGNVIVVGNFSGTIDFGGGPMTASMNDVFVAKLDPTGAHLWSKRFGVASGLSTGNSCESVAIDVDDNVIVTGGFSVNINFGGATLTSAGSQDAYLVKFDSAGNHVWSQRFGAGGNQYGRSVDVDDNGGIVFAGTFQTSMPFGGAGVVTNQVAVYVARVGADGTNTWIRGFGNWNDLWYRPSLSLAVGGDGSIAIGGEFKTSMDLGGGVFTAAPNDVSGYVGLLDGSGAHRWSVHLGGAQLQSVRGIGVDLVGNVDVTGSFEGTIDFGGLTRTSAGSSDVFAARFDPSGQVLWGESFGDTGVDAAVGIGVDAAGDLVLTGKFTGTINFGGVPLNGVSSSMYLAKLGEGSIGPVLSIALSPRSGAIEAQWDISSRWTLDRFFVLRDNSARTEPRIVAAGILGPNSGEFLDRDVEPGETYRYELVVTTPTGIQFRSPVVTATVPDFAATLAQNFPNPFNPRTTIAYSLQKGTDVVFEIYDVTGATVRLLREGLRDAGTHTIEWDGIDDYGNSVGSGVYFYRLVGVPGVAPKKMVLIK